MSTWTLAHTVTGEFFSELYRSNVILAAQARKHQARAFAGPLSLKGVLEGEAWWKVAGTRYRIDATSCLLVNRDVPYDMDLEAATPVRTFVLFFADSLVADVAHARFNDMRDLLDTPIPAAPIPLTLPQRLWTSSDGVHQALQQLHACSEEGFEQGEADLLLRRALDCAVDAALQVVREIERVPAEQASTRQELHRRIMRGKAHLDATLFEPFDLGRVAAEACLSPHHFHRTFRAIMGETPFAYVTRRRLDQAQRLLREQDRDVVEIAEALGYQSLTSFTRLFKRRAGCTPGAYREQFRKNG